MAYVKWIKVTGWKQFYQTSTYFVQVAEMEVWSASSKVLGGTAYAADFYQGYPKENTIDGNLSTSWISATSSTPQMTWFAVKLIEPVDIYKVRLYPRADFPQPGFRNATILGSLDSTDGVDGTWDVLAEGVNMAPTITWTEHPLSSGAMRPLPLPVIFNTLPASLSRGFR